MTTSAFLLECPHCGRATDSLKQYRVVHLMVIVIVAIVHQAATHTACPSCMRLILLKRAAVNTITAHFFAPILYFIYGIYALRTLSRGHSKGIEQGLATGLMQEAA